MRSGAHGSDEHPVPHHVLGIYDTDAFLVRCVVDAVAQADDTDAAAVVIAASRHHGPVRHGLAARGIDIRVSMDAGRYAEVDADGFIEQLTSEGGSGAERFDQAMQGLLGGVTRSREVVVCADVLSPLWARGQERLVLEIERVWGRRFSDPTVRSLCLYSSAVFRNGVGDDPFLALCQQHVLVGPVESYAALVDPTDERAVALLEYQDRAHRLDHQRLDHRRREVAAALARCLDEVSEHDAQLERALETRDVIGQAKGIIMVRWRLDADEAFAMLLDASHRSHRKLHDVARAVVQQQLRTN